MNKVGFIGYGSMGSMLLKGFLGTEILKAKQIIASTRNKNKLKALKTQWREIEIAKTNIDLAQKCKYIFICVEPLEVKKVLEEIVKYLNENVHLVSIAGCVTIENLESLFSGKITKVIPSLTSIVREGISLICHNNKVRDEDVEYIENLFNAISTVKIIKEENFEAAGNITSCAPGLIASIFQEFVEAGMRHSDITREEAEEMAICTLYGTSKLFFQEKMCFSETIKRVATKEGITEEGVNILQKDLPFIFDKVFLKTLEKHEKRKALIKKQFDVR